MFQGAAKWPAPEPAKPERKRNVVREVKKLLRSPAYNECHVGPYESTAGPGCLVRSDDETQVRLAQQQLRAAGYIVTSLHNFTGLGLGFTVYAHAEPGTYWRGSR